MSERKGKYSDVVEEGMKVLDKNMPGWECRIDPALLDLASCQLCVLGQIYGDYAIGKREVGIGPDGTDHGFSLKEDADKPREYMFLTKTWLRVIKRRLLNKLDLIACRGVK